MPSAHSSDLSRAFLRISASSSLSLSLSTSVIIRYISLGLSHSHLPHFSHLLLFLQTTRQLFQTSRPRLSARPIVWRFYIHYHPHLGLCFCGCTSQSFSSVAGILPELETVSLFPKSTAETFCPCCKFPPLNFGLPCLSRKPCCPIRNLPINSIFFISSSSAEKEESASFGNALDNYFARHK